MRKEHQEVHLLRVIKVLKVKRENLKERKVKMGKKVMMVMSSQKV